MLRFEGFKADERRESFVVLVFYIFSVSQNPSPGTIEETVKTVIKPLVIIEHMTLLRKRPQDLSLTKANGRLNSSGFGFIPSALTAQMISATNSTILCAVDKSLAL